MPSTSRQANNGKSKIFLETQTLLDTGITLLKNAFGERIWR